MADEGEKIRLLLVDDEEEFLTSAATALKRRGIEVQTACDGESALKIIEQDIFDVVVLDLKMPGIDGTEVARRIREKRYDLPVIILTGHGTISHAFEVVKESVCDYLAKPCDMDVLVNKIREVVKANTAEKKTENAGTINVLIVDDEEELLVSLKTVLERRGTTVTTAKSGKEALSLLGTLDTEVVILDVKMPDMDGLEVLEAIKRDHPLLEVVLLTGHPDVDNALRGIKMGACAYLVKPPEIEDLVETIRKAFDLRQAKLQRQQQQTVQDILKKYPD